VKAHTHTHTHTQLICLVAALVKKGCHPRSRPAASHLHCDVGTLYKYISIEESQNDFLIDHRDLHIDFSLRLRPSALFVN